MGSSGGGRAGLLQTGLVPPPQPGSRAGLGAARFNRGPRSPGELMATALGQSQAVEATRGSGSRTRGPTAVMGLETRLLPGWLRQGLKPKWGSWPLGLSVPSHDVAKQNSVTASDLRKRKSTGALPLTPKAEDQIVNMSSLHGYFLGPVLQSRELPDGFHLKGRIRKVKITQTQSQPAGTVNLEETPPLLRHLLLTTDLSDRALDSEGNT